MFCSWGRWWPQDVHGEEPGAQVLLLLCEDVIQGPPVSRNGVEQYVSTLETRRGLCDPCKAFQQPVWDR